MGKNWNIFSSQFSCFQRVKTRSTSEYLKRNDTIVSEWLHRKIHSGWMKIMYKNAIRWSIWETYFFVFRRVSTNYIVKQEEKKDWKKLSSIRTSFFFLRHSTDKNCSPWTPSKEKYQLLRCLFPSKKKTKFNGLNFVCKNVTFIINPSLS